MGKAIISITVFFALIAASMSTAISEDDILSGDKRTACEALLCLSSGKRPDECEPSLRKYFSIRRKKPSKTRAARKNFLKLCPDSESNSEMVALVEVIVDGAGRCDAKSLNRRRFDGEINDQMPCYCVAYESHGFTDFELPKYVGTPEEKGYWVEAEDYETALAAYNEWLVEKRRADEERRRMMEAIFNQR